MSNCPEPRQERDLKDRTFNYARRIVRLYKALGASTLEQTLGRQVLRSGTSVGANYREANRARSRAEFVAKIGDCLKEAEETEYWLDLLAAEEIVPASRLADLRDEAGQLAAVFITILNSSKRVPVNGVQEEQSEYDASAPGEGWQSPPLEVQEEQSEYHASAAPGEGSQSLPLEVQEEQSEYDLSAAPCEAQALQSPSFQCADR